ncbi:uncharacterized protein [Diadema setosum]|uniref:uncharacterized protein n=1 Tax=Diadema setosum TaxID=31175 RepID=UPI003B3A68A4
MTDVLDSRPDVWEGTASILVRSTNFLARLEERLEDVLHEVSTSNADKNIRDMNTELNVTLLMASTTAIDTRKAGQTPENIDERASTLILFHDLKESLTRKVPDIPEEEYTAIYDDPYEPPPDAPQRPSVTPDAPTQVTKRITIGHSMDTMGSASDYISTQTVGPSYLLRSRSTSDVSHVYNLPPQRQSAINLNEDEVDNRRASNAAVKELRSDETLSDYVMQFRRDQHREDGIEQTLRATDISQKSLKLACHKQSLVVAGVSTSLAKKLHVGDVLLRADNKALYTTHDCYDTFKCAVKHEVELQLLRVPQGVMCYVNLPEDGRIEALGAEFESDSFGVEVTKFNGSGLLVLSGQISNQFSAKFSKDEEKINLGLVEINRNPVPLDCSHEEVQNMLRNAGRELTLVFLPMDLVEVLHVAAGSEK